MIRGRFLLLWLLIFQGLSGCARPAHSGQQEAVSNALDINALTAKAEQGDATAQYMLGHANQCACGIPQNRQAAFIWYQKAAEQGQPQAEARLGWIYYNGDGVVIDRTKARKLFEDSAKAGIAEGKVGLAALYQHGYGGLPQDFSKAMAYFQQASDDGDMDADVQIGMMYWDGLGVKPDAHRAFVLIKNAAQHGNTSGEVEMAYFYHYGRDVVKDDVTAYAWALLAIYRGDRQARPIMDILEKTLTDAQKADAQNRADSLLS